MQTRAGQVINPRSPTQRADSLFGFVLVLPALLALLVVIALPTSRVFLSVFFL